MEFFHLCQIAIVASFFVVVKGQCNGTADIIIAVPSGWSIPHYEFISFEDNLIDLMYYFNIDPNQINIGLIRYGDRTTVLSSPQPYKSRIQVNTRITLLTQRNTTDGYGLDVYEAIRAMDKMAHHPSDFYPARILRDNAKKIGILFTYGNSTEAPGVVAAANEAKLGGMQLYAVVATGNSTLGPNFSEIGSGNCHLFSMNNYTQSLPFLIPDLASTICSELDPGVQVTPNNCRPRTYTTAPRLPVTCAKENNMVQADPNNCAYFYKCDYFNTEPQHQACPGNTVFDPFTGSCNFAHDVACYTDLQCPTGIPQLYPHPLDCQQFINCDEFYIPHVQTCPSGMLFDPVWQTCNDTADITCVLPRV